MSNTKTKALGLRLTLGGAPDTPHTIDGLPGLYRVSRATPVGGPGEPTEEQAREADRKRGTPVELVELTDKELETARTAHEADLIASRGGQADALSAVPDGAEIEQITDERSATSGR